MSQDTNISQELLETIERYLKNTMDAKEREDFDEKLKNNSLLSRQVNETQTLLFGVRKAIFKNKVNEFHEDLIQTKKPNIADNRTSISKFKYMSIAASIVLLIGGFWFFNKTKSNEALFNTYYIEDRGLETNMGETNQYAFDDAMVDYKHGKYKKAIEKWTVLLKNKPENDTLNYFLGVAYLANKNEDKAINYLKTATITTESVFINEAYFYLGLSYLKGNKTELAKKYFKQSNLQESKDILSQL